MSSEDLFALILTKLRRYAFTCHWKPCTHTHRHTHKQTHTHTGYCRYL